MLDSIDELVIGEGTSSGATELTTSSNVWALRRTSVLGSTPDTVFPVLKGFLVSVVVAELVNNDPAEHWLHESVRLENIERRVALQLALTSSLVLSMICTLF